MGDRANICMVQHPARGKTETLFLYTHWHGAALPRVLQSALQRGRDRWSDESYLARIIFCEMLKSASDPLDELTGFGISTYLTDNDRPILVLDCQTMKVGLSSEPDCHPEQPPPAVQEWTFEDYCDLLNLPWEELEDEFDEE